MRAAPDTIGPQRHPGPIAARRHPLSGWGGVLRGSVELAWTEGVCKASARPTVTLLNTGGRGVLPEGKQDPMHFGGRMAKTFQSMFVFWLH